MSGTVQITDFLVTHLPNATYIHEQWIKYGHPPLWNSGQFSGQPLTADPLSGYWYLPNWLTFLFPVPLAFNLLIYLHLAWSGLGLFLFLRKQGLSELAALIGSTAWMGTPKLISYIGSGQLSTSYAVSWLPWLLLSIFAMVQSPSWRKGIAAGALLAVIALADVRWGFYSSLLAGLYIISLLPGRSFSIRRLAAPVSTLLASVLILSAGLSLPLLEFLRLSRRSGISLAALSIFPVDGASLLGVLVPQRGVLWELVTYLGLAVLFLALIGYQRKHWFWAILGLLTTLFSLGEHSFLFPLFARILPGMSWMRVPSRTWFFVALAAAVLAGFGVERLLRGELPAWLRRWFPPFAFAFSILVVLLTLAVAAMFPPVPPGLLSTAVFAPLSLALLVAAFRWPSYRLVGLLGIVLCADLLWMNSSLFRSVPLEPAPPAVAWLEQQPGLFRVYSPSYSLPLPNGLQQANGVNPIHLDAYAKFMAGASNIGTGGYSVSLPDIYTDARTTPEIFRAAAAPDFEMLGELNVKYLALDFPLSSSQLPEKIFGQTRVYRNPSYRPRAWLVNDGSVEVIAWSPDKIELQASGVGGRLVLSEIAYPGWKARVDGNLTPVETAEGLFRAVELPPGSHRVTFAFQPLSFFLGSGISLAGWLAFFILSLRGYAAKLAARHPTTLS